MTNLYHFETVTSWIALTAADETGLGTVKNISHNLRLLKTIVTMGKTT